MKKTHFQTFLYFPNIYVVINYGAVVSAIILAFLPSELAGHVVHRAASQSNNDVDSRLWTGECFI